MYTLAKLHLSVSQSLLTQELFLEAWRVGYAEKLSEVRLSHTVLRTTLAAHSLELKVK